MVNTCLSLMLALGLHSGLEGHYNGLHPHLRCTVNNTIAGVYYNSEKKPSAYVGYTFDSLFDTELEIGWVTGYSGAKISPFARITKDNWYIAPAYEVTPTKAWGLTFGFEFPLFSFK